MNDDLDPAFREPAVRRFGRAAIAAALAVVLVVGLATLFFVARSTSEASRSADAIADCTTPGGKCWQRGQDGTAKAVKAITDDIERLETQRAASAARIQAILARLCVAQHVDCR